MRRLQLFCLLALAKLVSGFFHLSEEAEKTDTQTATFALGRDDLNKCLCNKRYKMCDNNCPCDADCPQDLRRLWQRKYLGGSEFIERVKAFACPQSFLSNVTFATEGLTRTRRMTQRSPSEASSASTRTTSTSLSNTSAAKATAPSLLETSPPLPLPLDRSRASRSRPSRKGNSATSFG